MTLPLHRVSPIDAAIEPLARRLEQGQILVFERGLYAARLDSGKVNYRPLEEKGRTIRARSSNEKIHTEAFVFDLSAGLAWERLRSLLDGPERVPFVSA